MVQLNSQPSPVLTTGDRICSAEDLQESGRGVRFQVQYRDQVAPAFAVRHAGGVSAFLNRCAHRSLELDWQEGEFFDVDKRFLVCATHDARYDPISGTCVSGPCRGAGLIALPVHETDGWVWLAKT